MSQPWTPVRSRGRSLALLLLLFGGGVPAADIAAAPKPPLRVRVPATAGMAVRRALLSAERRLADPRCRLVFSEFRLREVLERLGRTPAEHLGSLIFQDGTAKRACASPSILAFTSPGSPTVYVCGSQFIQAARAEPAYAEMVLIHEMLHTLGLGENPPTSGEITARVTELCGDLPVRRVAALP
jgi:hypothetical protein